MAVGTMIASDVPTQSCMRTASGTSRMRKTSYSTGTMTAPPPMPNSPARSPVTTPAAVTANPSQTSSPNGTPALFGRFLHRRRARGVARGQIEQFGRKPIEIAEDFGGWDDVGIFGVHVAEADGVAGLTAIEAA